MQRLEVSGAVRPIYGSLGVKRLKDLRILSTQLKYVFRVILTTNSTNRLVFVME